MNILAFDTSSVMLSSAFSGEGWSVSFSIEMGTKHTERLLDAIDICVSRSGMSRSAIDLIACALGPGSFTGLRIGMSTAKGLSLALGRPWVAVPVLDCHAYGLEVFPGAVIPVIDGRKGRVYAAVYERGMRMGDWLDISARELAAAADVHADVLFCGPDAEIFEPYCLERPGFRIYRDSGRPVAGAMTALAADIFANQGPAPDDLGPLYLRDPEAVESILR